MNPSLGMAKSDASLPARNKRERGCVRRTSRSRAESEDALLSCGATATGALPTVALRTEESEREGWAFARNDAGEAGRRLAPARQARRFTSCYLASGALPPESSSASR